jgi:hypothetical protein
MPIAHAYYDTLWGIFYLNTEHIKEAHTIYLGEITYTNPKITELLKKGELVSTMLSKEKEYEGLNKHTINYLEPSLKGQLNIMLDAARLLEIKE